MTDVYGVYLDTCIVAGTFAEDAEIYFSIKEADSRNIPHIAKACEMKVKKVVVM